jgi:hypothetical protein
MGVSANARVGEWAIATKWLNRIAQGFSQASALGLLTIMDRPERAPETRIVLTDRFRQPRI